MATLTKKITATAKANDLRPRWHVLDANGQVLGRLAVQIAHLLKGKHKPNYSPHMLTGDFVIVINAAKIRVTGRKAEQKVYYSHSQYPGGLKEVPYESMMARHPARIIEHAVKGMLPHNRLGRQMLRRLKVYANAEHPHESQVAGSLKAEKKDREEGTVWIGLPQPQYKKRARKVRETAAAEPEVASSAQVPAKTDIPEEPTADAGSGAEDSGPSTEAEDAVEKLAAEAETGAEDVEPVAESEGAAEKVAEPAAETEAVSQDAEPAVETRDDVASEPGAEEKKEGGT